MSRHRLGGAPQWRYLASVDVSDKQARGVCMKSTSFVPLFLLAMTFAVSAGEADIHAVPGVLDEEESHYAALVAASARGDKPHYTLSLRQAEQLALQYSHELRQARLNRRVASGRTMRAYGEALPQVTTSFGHQYYRKPDSMRPGNVSAAQAPDGKIDVGVGKDRKDLNDRHYLKRYDWSVTGTQPLFKGGKIIADIRGAGLYRDSVKESIRLTKQQLLYNVRADYYDLRYAEKLVDIFTTQINLAQEFLATTRNRYQAGTITDIEVTRAEVDVSNNQALLIQAENGLATQRTSFLKLLGLPLGADLTLTDGFLFEDFDPGEERRLRDLELRDRPELRQARLQEKLQEKSIQTTRSALFPQVNLTGTYSANNHTWTTETGRWRKNWSVGVQMDWLVFDGLVIHGQIREAQAVLEQYKLDTYNTRDTIKLEVRTALLNLFSAMEFVRSQRENVLQAERVVKQQTIQWEEGAGGLYLEIIDARKSLATAQQNYFAALRDYHIARTDLERAQGKIGEDVFEAALSEVKGVHVVRADERTRIYQRESRMPTEDFFGNLPVPEEAKPKPAPAEQGAVPGETAAPALPAPRIIVKPEGHAAPSRRPAMEIVSEETITVPSAPTRIFPREE